MSGRKNTAVRLRRADCFLGIHFDYHMRPHCTEVGKNVTPRMVQRIIDKVKPDFIQVDCKGHPGISGYATKIGTPAPGFVRDQLRIWRDVTARFGVGLFAHYSGVVDGQMLKKHPSWCQINVKGERWRGTSVFGPYVEKVMIPQLKELCDQYEFDGVWVDGDCWGVEKDYSKWAIDAFLREKGIAEVPRKPGDKNYFRFLEFLREGYRCYLNKYVDALHQHRPEFQVASNWAYSSLMPEPVEADIDFISGDYAMNNSVNLARFEARVMARQGKPWDLMAWGFIADDFGDQSARSTKTAIQLQQEAAVTISLGGGFQVYFRQKADGSIHEWEMDTMAEVAEFCRARQEYCHKAEIVPQIALLYSRYSMYRTDGPPFSHFPAKMPGFLGSLQSLLDSQNCVEVLVEHQLQGRTQEYPLIIIPEWLHLLPSLKKELLEYVERGGNLLLIGPKMARRFTQQLRVKLRGRVVETHKWLMHGERLWGMKTISQKAELLAGAKVYGRLYDENEMKGAFVPAASVARLGKGRIAATYFNYGDSYLNTRTNTARDFLGGLVRELMPKPMVEVSGSHYVDVVLTRKNNRLLVNLINTAGPHEDSKVFVFDEIPAVGPLEVLVRTGVKPNAVKLMPKNRGLRCTYRDGEVRFVLSRLELHEIVALDGVLAD